MWDFHRKVHEMFGAIAAYEERTAQTMSTLNNRPYNKSTCDKPCRHLLLKWPVLRPFTESPTASLGN